MIFYLRNNRVIARFKRIDNAARERAGRRLERPFPGEKLRRDRENELYEKRELRWTSERGRTGGRAGGRKMRGGKR